MTEQVSVTCCIAGGGPAGMMLGFLLARAGIDVLVLEKHRDFLRDFRGDTIHPSTMEIMHELGLLDAFLKLPHQEVPELTGMVGDVRIPIADFRHLKTKCRFVAFMPQWDFLNFLATQAARFKTFNLRMQTEVTDLILDGTKVAGLRALGPDGPVEFRAKLVIGADGRHSLVRDKAGLKVEELSVPIDVLWFRLSRLPSDPAQSLGRFDAGYVFVMINRGDNWQCGLVIPKGAYKDIQRAGLPAFRENVARYALLALERTRELTGWDRIKLLTIVVDRLALWFRPGLLCIGDAAHAMSPIGGVGINLAIQDAVAAANILAEPLRSGSTATAHLRRVQRRRTLATRVIQRLQIAMQNRIVRRVLGSRAKIVPPFVLRLFIRLPVLRRIPARLIGVGIRPEHVRTPEMTRGKS